MTYLIGVRCDLCGKTVTEPYEGQKHESPEGWGTCTMHYPIDGPNNQHRDVCPDCVEALLHGETIISGYFSKTIHDSPIIPCDGGPRT